MLYNYNHSVSSRVIWIVLHEETLIHVFLDVFTVVLYRIVFWFSKNLALQIVVHKCSYNICYKNYSSSKKGQVWLSHQISSEVYIKKYQVCTSTYFDGVDTLLFHSLLVPSVYKWNKSRHVIVFCWSCHVLQIHINSNTKTKCY